eukprot:SAG22_NODE_867_length_6776_cov_2.480455_5_plen_144_part_00
MVLTRKYRPPEIGRIWILFLVALMLRRAVNAESRAKERDLLAQQAEAEARLAKREAEAGADSRMCPICLERYHESNVVPRVLVGCGHTICEGCLSQMLAPVLAKGGKKQVECPKCRRKCEVKRGNPASLPLNYDILVGPAGKT